MSDFTLMSKFICTLQLVGLNYRLGWTNVQKSPMSCHAKSDFLTAV